MVLSERPAQKVWVAMPVMPLVREPAVTSRLPASKFVPEANVTQKGHPHPLHKIKAVEA